MCYFLAYSAIAVSQDMLNSLFTQAISDLTAALQDLNINGRATGMVDMSTAYLSLMQLFEYLEHKEFKAAWELLGSDSLFPNVLHYFLATMPHPQTGDTALIKALKEDAPLNIISRLIDLKAPVNQANNQGACPIHILAAKNRFNALPLLAKNSEFDVNAAEGKLGFTALHIAAGCNHMDTAIKLLQEYGANINVLTKNQQTALHRACLKGHFAMTQALLLMNIDYDAQDANQWTALHCAAYKDFDDCVSVLISHGANETLRTNQDKTAQALAKPNAKRAFQTQHAHVELPEHIAPILVATHDALNHDLQRAVASSHIDDELGSSKKTTTIDPIKSQLR